MKNLLTPFAREAWLPVLMEGTDAFQASKFGGIPYLNGSESWPLCPHCGKPMPLFFQIAGSDLPPGFEQPWQGLLQMFYCVNDCEWKQPAYEPFCDTHLLRIVMPDTTCGSPSISPVEDPFPARIITGWTVAKDFPCATELLALGLPVDDADVDALEEEGLKPSAGEKLGGWPLWIQDVEYPACRVCASPMRLLIQVDSDGAVPHMFGDCGVGHVTQCPHHASELAFGWACC